MTLLAVLNGSIPAGLLKFAFPDRNRVRRRFDKSFTAYKALKTEYDQKVQQAQAQAQVLTLTATTPSSPGSVEAGGLTRTRAPTDQSQSVPVVNHEHIGGAARPGPGGIEWSRLV